MDSSYDDWDAARKEQHSSRSDETPPQSLASRTWSNSWAGRKFRFTTKWGGHAGGSKDWPFLTRVLSGSGASLGEGVSDRDSVLMMMMDRGILEVLFGPLAICYDSLFSQHTLTTSLLLSPACFQHSISTTYTGSTAST